MTREVFVSDYKLLCTVVCRHSPLKRGKTHTYILELFAMCKTAVTDICGLKHYLCTMKSFQEFIAPEI
jgi:hypothetical protein